MSLYAPLVVNNLTKVYSYGIWPFRKSFIAVNSISFVLKNGEILGLLGPNGAGKTTTIQMLLGLLTSTSGNVTYFGKDFFKNSSEILKQVTYGSGYDKLPSRLSIKDNLDIYGRLYGVPDNERPDRIMKLLKFFDMWNLRNKPTGMLSAGQMTRIILAKAFLPRPLVVLLDEPTASLDPDVSHDVRNFIIEEKKQHGTSILFCSHNMQEVTELCDRILMLKDGTIIADDKPANLAATVSTAHINLVVTEGRDKLIEYIEQNNLTYKQEGHTTIINVDEQRIGEFLVAIVKYGVVYSHVSIDKPTLEDYFLSKVKRNK